MDFRVKQTCNLEGECIYYPQYKKWLWWFNFWDFTDFPPKCKKFNDLNKAKTFLINQKSNPTDKFHYL